MDAHRVRALCVQSEQSRGWSDSIRPLDWLGDALATQTGVECETRHACRRIRMHALSSPSLHLTHSPSGRVCVVSGRALVRSHRIAPRSRRLSPAQADARQHAPVGRSALPRARPLPTTEPRASERATTTSDAHIRTYHTERTGWWATCISVMQGGGANAGRCWDCIPSVGRWPPAAWGRNASRSRLHPLEHGLTTASMRQHKLNQHVPSLFLLRVLRPHSTP